MNLIDTHTHLFLEHFDNDRNTVINNAISKGITKFFLPNIDSSSIQGVLELAENYPKNCFPLIGLHPTSVKENYKEELDIIEKYLASYKFYGIGESGIDLYWDKTYLKEQEDAFRFQIELAKKHQLPLIIHVRDSFNEVFKIIDELNDDHLSGIFHCFTGDYNQAGKIIDYGGFKLGIGGVVTFKNSNLGEILAKIAVQHLVLETDSPYLAPVPYRGKRNESAYLINIAQKIAEIYQISPEELAEITNESVKEVFKMIT